jgi:hypothetical protein
VETSRSEAFFIVHALPIFYLFGRRSKSIGAAQQGASNATLAGCDYYSFSVGQGCYVQKGTVHIRLHFDNQSVSVSIRGIELVCL